MGGYIVCHGLVLSQQDSRRFASAEGVDCWSKNDYLVVPNKVKGFKSAEVQCSTTEQLQAS